MKRNAPPDQGPQYPATLAWLVAQGYKNIENRTWPTSYQGPVLIHASKRPDPQMARISQAVQEQFGIHLPDRLDFGGIVGIATIAGCVQHSFSPWFSRPQGFILKDARPLTCSPWDLLGRHG